MNAFLELISRKPARFFQLTSADVEGVFCFYKKIFLNVFSEFERIQREYNLIENYLSEAEFGRRFLSIFYPNLRQKGF